MQNTLIKDAINYYDDNSEKYKNWISSIDKLQIVDTYDEITRNKLQIYINNGKVYVSGYETIGSYLVGDNLWRWSWAEPTYHKKRTYTIAKILKYGIELDPSHKFLKHELVTSQFRITNNVQIIVHVAIASYLAKIQCILPCVEFRDGNFTVLKDIDNIPNLPHGSRIIFIYILNPPSSDTY